MLASGSGRDAWMHSDDDLEGAGDGYDTKDERPTADCDIVIRMAFIRKVYSILLVQLIATTAISAFLHLSKTATEIMHKT